MCELAKSKFNWEKANEINSVNNVFKLKDIEARKKAMWGPQWSISERAGLEG
jgi:hypothetical protein